MTQAGILYVPRTSMQVQQSLHTLAGISMHTLYLWYTDLVNDCNTL